jgi:methionyl-tRNA formyltransferase
MTIAPFEGASNGTTPRILFLGMTGALSRAPLAALLEADYDVRALFIPAARETAPALRLLPPLGTLPPAMLSAAGHNSVHLAWAAGIPVFAVGDLTRAAVAGAVAAMGVDVACVSCFPQRVPTALRAQVPHGFLNLHPSWLPAYRGPYPLFWQFRDGVRESGVTLHVMDEELDTGDIVAQASWTLTDGMTNVEAEAAAGEAGGRLLVAAMAQLATGVLPRHAQPAGGSYQGKPTADDFTLDRGWSARRAYNFMRGSEGWNVPYPIVVAGQRRQLARALAFTADTHLPDRWQEDGEEVRVQFAAGVLHATLA